MDWDSVWEPVRFAPPDSPDGGLIVYNWMTEIGMSPTTRNIYALIYQYSADGAGYYTGGAAYAARRCGVSEKTAWRAIRDLLNAGLVRETVPHVRGDSRSCATLQAVIGRVGEFRTKWLDHSPETTLTTPFPAEAPMDKMSVGAPAPMDRMSVGVGRVGEFRTKWLDHSPETTLTTPFPAEAPMDKMSVGAPAPMDRMSVGETGETAGECVSMDKVSSDQWTECPLEAHKDNKPMDRMSVGGP